MAEGIGWIGVVTFSVGIGGALAGSAPVAMVGLFGCLACVVLVAILEL